MLKNSVKLLWLIMIGLWTVSQLGSERATRYEKILSLAELNDVKPEDLQPYKDLVNVADCYGRSLAERAINSGKDVFLECLIVQGADIEQEEDTWVTEKRTLLSRAISNGSKRSVEILLKAGAQITPMVKYLLQEDHYWYNPEKAQLVKDEEVGRQRWRGKDGLRAGWVQATVEIAGGAAEPVGVGAVTDDDLRSMVRKSSASE